MPYQTKEQQVAEFIREGIISGKFSRGTKLKQVELAHMLDISVTPVREALKLLEAEGYVIGVSHRGHVVAPFDVNSAAEVLTLRTLLEGKLMLAAVAQMKENDLTELLELQKAFKTAAANRDRTAVRAINFRFHMRLYSIPELPQTLNVVRVLWARYPFDLINHVPGRMGRAAEEHNELLEHVAGGDAVSAVNTLTRHIHAGWDEFLASQGQADDDEAPAKAGGDAAESWPQHEEIKEDA